MQRPLKFVKYLPEFGWTPVVLTVNPGHLKYVQDPSLLADLPEAVEVHRTFFPDLRRVPLFRGSLGRVLFPPVERRLLPGFEVLWNPFARRRARRILGEGRVDLVFSTSPPNAVHLLGRDLGRREAIPWVADLRDEWTTDSNRRAYYAGLSARALKRARALERTVLRSADHLVVTSPAQAERLAELHTIPRERITTITNGYDAADFEGYAEDPPPRGDVFRVVYTGNLATQDPRPFIRALDRLVAKKKVNPTRIDVRFYTTSTRRGAALQMPGVHVEPYLPHRELAGVFEKAHALLLFLEAGDRVKIPGKLFEYLRARRPILALVPEEGPTADILRRTRAGVVVPPDDPDRIEAALFEIYTAWNQSQLASQADPAEVARYERRVLTRELARVFDTTVDRSGSASATS